jgi:hypothetical protein
MRDYGLWYKLQDGAPICVPYTNPFNRLVEGIYSSAVVGRTRLGKVAYGGSAQHLTLKEHC